MYIGNKRWIFNTPHRKTWNRKTTLQTANFPIRQLPKTPICQIADLPIDIWCDFQMYIGNKRWKFNTSNRKTRNRKTTPQTANSPNSQSLDNQLPKTATPQIAILRIINSPNRQLPNSSKRQLTKSQTSTFFAFFNTFQLYSVLLGFCPLFYFSWFLTKNGDHSERTKWKSYCWLPRNRNIASSRLKNNSEKALS